VVLVDFQHKTGKWNLQGVLTLALSTIRVNRGDGKALVVEIVIDHVALDLGVGKDQGATRLAGEDQIEEGLLLGRLLHVDNLLVDILVSAAHTADPRTVSHCGRGFKSGNSYLMVT
jgi:hypothetical protein